MRHARAMTTLPLVLALTACGDDGASADGDGTSGTGTASSAGTSTGEAGSSTTTGDGTTASTGSSGGSSSTSGSSVGTDSSGTSSTGAATTGNTSSGTDTATTTAGVGVDVTLDDLMLFQDCKPIKQPDPVQASFSVTVDNGTAAPVTATVVSAEFVSGVMPVATLDVTPTSYGPVAAGMMQGFAGNKVAMSMMPANGCSVLLCNGLYDLEITFDVDGAMFTATTTAQMSCVF